MKNLFTIHLLIFVFFFISCSKDDKKIEPEPENPAGTGTLQTDIIGKWIVSSISGRTTADGAFLEFMADSTYIIYNITEDIAIGKYVSDSDKSAKLQGFGEITGISLSQDKITCTLTSSAGRKFTIAAAKAQEIGTDDRTRLLARNWALTSEEDGGLLLTSDSDPTVKFDIDFTFSASGTYLVTYKFQGQIDPGVKGNWKWHSTAQDRIVYWLDGEQINENQNMLVRTLTANMLKLTDKNDVGDFNMTLKPSK